MKERKVATLLRRCIICREQVASRQRLTSCQRLSLGRKVKLPGNWVLCPTCNKDWLWYPKGRYFRRRVREDKWERQLQLMDNIIRVVKERAIGSKGVISEVGFPDWAISKVGGFLRFDVAVPKLKLLVDYHGEQHYTPDNPYHKGNWSTYNRQRANDKLKRELTANNGWAYLIFSYREDVSNLGWVRRRLDRVWSEVSPLEKKVGGPLAAAPKVPRW